MRRIKRKRKILKNSLLENRGDAQIREDHQILDVSISNGDKSFGQKNQEELLPRVIFQHCAMHQIKVIGM